MSKPMEFVASLGYKPKSEVSVNALIPRHKSTAEQREMDEQYRLCLTRMGGTLTGKKEKSEFDRVMRLSKEGVWVRWTVVSTGDKKYKPIEMYRELRKKGTIPEFAKFLF